MLEFAAGVRLAPAIFHAAQILYLLNTGNQLTKHLHSHLPIGEMQLGICQIGRDIGLQTGLPLRTTSVITATTDVVISEKSKLELASFDLSGIAVSRISTIRMK